MKKKQRNTEAFSLAFLDIITCGFGAMLLLLIIVKPIPVESVEDAESPEINETIAKLSVEVSDLKNLHSKLNAQEQSKSDIEETDAQIQKRSVEINDASRKLRQIQEDNEGLEIALESLKRATIQVPANPKKRDPEVGGIPVDSEYVIFILDNSGSMMEIWPQVLSTMDRILDIHPTVKGFQVMNDNGTFLINSTKRKWIPDTSRRRNFVKQQLRTWNVFSNSSPAEGLELALTTYARRYNNISIYVIGDEYTGSSYDKVVESIRRRNTRSGKKEPIVRIHAIGFISLISDGRYATLMRAVTERNRGAFIGLPLN